MFLEFISDTSNVIPPKTLDVSQGTEVIPPHQRVNLSGKPKRAPAPEPPSISEDLQIKKKHLLILCRHWIVALQKYSVRIQSEVTVRYF